LLSVDTPRALDVKRVDTGKRGQANFFLAVKQAGREKMVLRGDEEQRNNSTSKNSSKKPAELEAHVAV
jgi:hypothetical protein